MDKDNERCIICGDRFSDDDIKIYCPDCGAPMHKDCYEVEGKCPNSDNHIKKTDNGSSHKERMFPDGNGCEICGRPFEENDERVYCPDCGAPMHRLCYNLTHRCPYTDEHTPRPSAAATYLRKSGRTVCDKCGKPLDNGEEKVYCPVCGTPVHKSCWEKDPVCPNESRHSQGYDWEAEHKKPEMPQNTNTNMNGNFSYVTYENFPDMIMSNPIRSSENGEELTCHGVKQSELVHFLGLHNFSTPRFFTLFMNMANSGKIFSLNISAWFFMPLYHYYRRMTGPAIIITLATFILMIPSLIYQAVIFRNIGSDTVDISFDALLNITSYLMILFRVALLLFNDYIYMRWSVRKILSMREQYKDASTDEYYAALENKGNPRMMYVLGGVSLILLLVYLLNVLISAMGIV